MAKKPPLTDAERKAKLDRLTAQASPLNILADLPSVVAAPAVAPAPEAPEPVSTAGPTVSEPPALEPATQPATAPLEAAPEASTAEALNPAPEPIAATPVDPPTEAPVVEEQKGKSEPAPALAPVTVPVIDPVVVLAPALTASREVIPEKATAPVDVADEPEEEGEELAQPEAVATPVAAFDLAALFKPTSDKKDTTLRITSDHQKFFTKVGIFLGDGATAPDIIHNILMLWRTQHEPEIIRAMKKASRQLFK